MLLNTNDAVGDMLVKTTGVSLIKAMEKVPVKAIRGDRCSFPTSRP